MIDTIKGRIIELSPTKLVVDIGGIALALAAPVTTVERLGGVGDEVVLRTYLHVRDDILDLYGFGSASERDLFVRLLKLSGVGPKMALAVLSRFDPPELADVVANQDVRRLTSVQGIGRKTAERLIVELKDRLKPPDTEFISTSASGTSLLSEAMQALEVLGYPATKAEQAVRQALQQKGENATVEEVVKQALRY